MYSSSNDRRSSTNPVRVSLINREDKSFIRTDPKKAHSKTKASSSTDVSHIPRPRMRSSSCDPATNRRSNLKGTGKSVLHPSTTPVTPLTNVRRLNAIGLSTGKRTPSGDRASNIGAKSNRKDRRQLTDKNYQTFMLNKIDSYIHEIQCSSMLNSNGSLKPITLKIFVEVSGLLVKLIDPKQVLTLANYLDELPKIAKKLHYPGVLTKSLLKTANTTHSWPFVLGWLSWLVEVCQVKDIGYNYFQFDNIPFENAEQETNESKNNLYFMISMYKAWNDEKLEEEEALTKKYLQELERLQGISDDELEKARNDLAVQENNLEANEKRARDLEAEIRSLQDILKSLEEDAAKQADIITANEKYITKIKTETEQMEIQCKHLKEHIEIQKKHHANLLSAVKKQPMSKMEKVEMLNKYTELQSYNVQFDEHLKEIQKDIYTLDIKLASVNNKLNKIVFAYNREIFIYFGSNGNIDIEQLKMPEKGMLEPQIMEKLNEKATLMNGLKDRLKQDLAELEILDEKEKALKEENAILQKKLEERIAELNNGKREENKILEQIQILENDIKKYQESIPDLQSLRHELEETKDKLDAVQRRKMYIEHNGKEFFGKFYEMLGEHRNNLCKILKKGEES